MVVAVASSYSLPHKRTSIPEQLNTLAAFKERHQSLVKLQEKLERIKKNINKTNIFYLPNFKFINRVVEDLEKDLLLLEEKKRSLAITEYWTDWISLQLPSSEVSELEEILSRKILSVTERQYLDLVKKTIESQEIEKKLELLNGFFEFTKNDRPSYLSTFFNQRKDDLILQKQKMQEEIESRKLDVREGLNKREGFRLI